MFGDVTYSPKFGGYFAELKTGVETKISQSVFLRGGQKLAGWAAFDAQVDLPSSSHAKVTVYNQAKTIFKVIWESNVADVGRFGTSPWTRWEWVAPVRGSYTLEYTVGSFSGGNSYGLFDSFELFKPEMNLNR
jgi:hypothetical protein